MSPAASASNATVEPRPARWLEARPRIVQALLYQGREHILLGEGLCADDIACVRLDEGGHAADDEDENGRRRGEREPATIAARERELDAGEERIDEEREDCRGHAAEQHEDPILRLQAGEDVVAETGLADGASRASRCR